MKTFVETQLEKLVVLNDEKQTQIQKVKKQVYKTIGRIQILKSDQEIQAEAEVVKEKYDLMAETIEKQIIENIKENEKKAYQEYYAAETKPTDEQVRESQQLVSEFKLKMVCQGTN